MAKTKAAFKLSIAPRKATLILLYITFGLVAMHLMWQSIMWSGVEMSPFLWETGMRFNMDIEISIPTWYNQMLFIIAAAIAMIIALAKYANNGEMKAHWVGIVALLTYMSMDEGASLHETLGLLDIPKHLGIDGPLFVFGWVFLGLILVGVVSAIFFKFWLNLPRKTRYLFVAAVAVFVGGAIGIEMINGYYSSINGIDYIYNGPLVALEEMLEHIGVIIAIYALLDYAQRYKAKLELSVDNQ